MSPDEIQAMITQGLVATFQLEPSRITPDARLYDDLELDSIDIVDLAATLQSETGIRLAPADFKSVSTIGDLIAVLIGPLNAARPGSSAEHRRDGEIG